MPKTFADDLDQRAGELAADIEHQSASQTWVINGRWGSGKSSLLRALQPHLLQRGLLPIVVAPPPRDMDTGPAALLQIAEALHEQGFLNGELERLQDPAEPWSKKLSATMLGIQKHRGDVVLLCDEPGKWKVPPTAKETFSPYNNRHIEQVVEQILHGVDCKRVLTHPSGLRSGDSRPYDLPKDTHPSWLLDSSEQWGDLADVAHDVHKRLGAKLAVATPLEIRLLVALAAVTTVSQVDSYYRAEWPESQAIALRLATAMEAHDEFAALRTLWSQLALCRGSISPDLLRGMGAETLNPKARAVLYNGLLHWRAPGYEMSHVLRFQERVASWLDVEGRLAAHRRLADYYGALMERIQPQAASLSRELEAFHHASEAADAGALQRFRPLFVDQLNQLGRALSKDARDFAAAADVFRKAIEWDDDNDYAHHYLAYNVDWLATDPGLAEQEYERAIDLNPEHPWWWSRWINFLITVGRPRDARAQWREAVSALGVTSGEPPDTVYQSLHLPVARLLVHRMQLDFAETVLTETPSALRQNDSRFRALTDLLAVLRETERARAVFPLSVPFADWWNGPHLDFPRETPEGRLEQWFPAQVDEVDDAIVHLIMAKRDRDDGKVTYAQVELPREQFDRASMDEPSERLQAGRFLELAFYGAQEALHIRTHPETLWQALGLPALDPDPRRYLRIAGIGS